MAADKLLDPMTKGGVSEILVQRITDALIDGSLKPGDKLPTEMEFKESLGVGRNSVREAIKVLEAFGVLEIRRSEGTFVVSEFNHRLLDPIVYGLILSNHSLEELLDFKATFLNAILFLAIKKSTAEDIAELRRLLEEFTASMQASTPDFPVIYDKSIAFNEYLGRITRNEMIVQLNDIAIKIAKFTRIEAIKASVQLDRPLALPEIYGDIINVLEDGDKMKIPALMDHIMEVWETLLE